MKEAKKRPEARAPEQDLDPKARAAEGSKPVGRKTQRLSVTRGDETFEFNDRLPVLPLRELVVFPYMTIPLLVGRAASVQAVERAVARDRVLFCVAQKRSELADPGPDELHTVGTVVRVRRVGDRDPERLRYLAQLGITPGADVRVVERAPFGGPMTLRIVREGALRGAERGARGAGDRECAIGPALAAEVFVETRRGRG